MPLVSQTQGVATRSRSFTSMLGRWASSFRVLFLTKICFVLLFAAAARALVDIPDLTAEDVAERSMKVAANMCVYINTEFIMESIKTVEENEDTEGMENGKKE